MRITWLGHAATLVEVSGFKILIDPWVTNPLSPYKSVEDFVRSVEGVDYIFVTHDHGDHVGDSIELMRSYKEVKLIAVYELASDLASRAGVPERAIGANIGGPIKLGNNLMAVLTPAYHSSSVGSPTGVIIVSNEGTLYHAGDTGLFSDMTLLSELYGVTVALLPIGGHFTMGIKEAVKAVQLLNPRYVIPIHYNTFDVIKVEPQEFIEGVMGLRLPVNTILLKPGESFTI